MMAEGALQIAGREEAVLSLHGHGGRMEVDHCSFDERVAELLFNFENVRATNEHVGGERNRCGQTRF